MDFPIDVNTTFILVGAYFMWRTRKWQPSTGRTVRRVLGVVLLGLGFILALPEMRDDFMRGYNDARASSDTISAPGT